MYVCIIQTPSTSLEEELRQLRSLSRAGLAHQDDSLVALDELQELLPSTSRGV